MVQLESFGDQLNVVVIGASGGIGHAVVTALSRHPKVRQVFALSRRPTSAASGPKIVPGRVDLLDEAAIARAAEMVAEAGPLDLVFLASGMLHQSADVQPEKTWGTLDPAAMDLSFRINAIGPALVAKHFLPLLTKDRKSVFAALSARVGSISDNQLGGWYSYRASKAALNMLLKTLSIELARRNSAAVCVGLHPGTVDTELSKPFQRGVPADKLFPPSRAAEQLITVLDGLTSEDSGKIFAWDSSVIPF